MASNAQILLGSTFAFAGDTIGEVTSVNGDIVTRQRVDVHSADSTNGMADTLKGTGVYGDLQIGCILDPTASGAMDGLVSAAAAGTSGIALFTFPDNTTVAASASFLSQLGFASGDPNSPFDVSLTVTPTVAWAYTDKA